jgi:hypothetical protein
LITFFVWRVYAAALNYEGWSILSSFIIYIADKVWILVHLQWWSTNKGPRLPKNPLKVFLSSSLWSVLATTPCLVYPIRNSHQLTH